MIKLKTTDIIIVSGERGTGKTTLAKHLAKQFIPRIVVYDALGEYGFDTESYASRISEFENIYVPCSAEPEEFEKFMDACWNIGNMMIVVDEAETFMPEGKVLTPSTFRIVMQGRHRNLGLICTTKRIAELKKTVVSQAKYVMLFRHFLKNDVEYVRTFAGDKAYELKDLHDYNFLVYSLGECTGAYFIKNNRP